MSITSPTDVGLPTARDFDDVEVPEFARKYTKRQGPASIKKSVAGRVFSASGPKADLIARIIFADMKLTRTQIAKIAGCSPSRVSEIIWAIEDAINKGQLASWPEVPRTAPASEPAAANASPEPDEQLAEQLLESVAAHKSEDAE